MALLEDKQAYASSSSQMGYQSRIVQFSCVTHEQNGGTFNSLPAPYPCMCLPWLARQAATGLKSQKDKTSCETEVLSYWWNFS